MKKEYVLLNLREAKEAIEQLISEIENEQEYGRPELSVDMQHIYWHINSAWNGQEFDIEGQELTDELYESFIQYPKDLEL